MGKLMVGLTIGGGNIMRSLFMSLVVAICLVFGLPEATAQVRVTVNVPATARWVDTGLDVVAGDLLEVQAVGTWTDGGSTSGPEGSADPWPDNFLNLTDLGACSVCARTLTEGHGALIGYIGDSPPAAGSYTSTAVLSEAVKVFYIGANFRANASFDGRLWLNKNADAYSGYTIDNRGFVTATVTATTEAEMPSVPAVPSNLSVFMTSEGAGIGVSWTDNSDNEEGFDIGYSPTQDSNNAQRLLVGSDQTFLSSDWGLNHDQNGLLGLGQTMCFQVSAYNAAGSSAPTPWSCITIPSRVTLSLNQSSFQLGDTGIVRATVTTGDSVSPVDVYLVLQLPDQTLLFSQSDGSLTQEVRPLVSNWTVTPFSGELFRHTFSSADPAGTYTWYAFFTDPGTLNLTVDFAQASFTFPVSRIPQGKAPNLVVLVHGCCTNANDVQEIWDSFGKLIADTIVRNQTPGPWEIVVWDWSDKTPKIGEVIDPFGDAYDNALSEGLDLARAIEDYPTTYKYVHFIGHSAGANLINWAAKSLAGYKLQGNEERPFIHLTFLDAYTRTKKDSGEEEDSGVRKGYGYLEGYHEHYAEHYVDIGLASTDACLVSAFNFDITGWSPDKDDRLGEFGHQWPRRWYEKSVPSLFTGYKYGYPLSLEGSGKNIDELVNELDQYPAGQQCSLLDIGTICIPAPCPSPGRF